MDLPRGGPLVGLLVMVLGLSCVLKQRLARRQVPTSPGGKLSLVLLNAPSAGRAARLAHLLGAARWPTHVEVDSTAGLVVAMDYDLEPLPRWDEIIWRGARPGGLASFHVPELQRVERHRAQQRGLPRIRFGKTVLQVPDFRAFLGPGPMLEPLLAHWFPSYFWGLLAYPLHIELCSVFATDPVGAGDGKLRQRDATTLMALGLSGLLHESIWRRCLTLPAPVQDA